MGGESEETLVTIRMSGGTKAEPEEATLFLMDGKSEYSGEPRSRAVGVVMVGEEDSDEVIEFRRVVLVELKNDIMNLSRAKVIEDKKCRPGRC